MKIKETMLKTISKMFQLKKKWNSGEKTLRMYLDKMVKFIYGNPKEKGS